MEQVWVRGSHVSDSLFVYGISFLACVNWKGIVKTCVTCIRSQQFVTDGRFSILLLLCCHSQTIKFTLTYSVVLAPPLMLLLQLVQGMCYLLCLSFFVPPQLAVNVNSLLQTSQLSHFVTTIRILAVVSLGFQFCRFNIGVVLLVIVTVHNPSVQAARGF